MIHVRVLASLYMIMNQLFSRPGDRAGVLVREVSPAGQRILANHPSRELRWASGLPRRDAMTPGSMNAASVTYHRQGDDEWTLARNCWKHRYVDGLNKSLYTDNRHIKSREPLQ
jgi:hypothetical protein